MEKLIIKGLFSLIEEIRKAAKMSHEDIEDLKAAALKDNAATDAVVAGHQAKEDEGLS